MRARPRQLPGAWLVMGLLAAAISGAAWLRANRIVAPSAAGGRLTQPAPSWPDMRIDVNTASGPELDVLPGIGPRLAERIVADRAAHGPFATLDDLARVPGVGQRLVEGVRPFAVAEPEPES
ncbi:MAG: ComEA family DNA-binding protein [Planctomycetota bacterium]